MTRAVFAGAYAAAFRGYVAERNESRLKAAYDLGRTAVEQGLGVLDVAAAHNDAVAAAARATADADDVIEASSDFLIESLASFEMVQRGATEALRAAWEERRRARMVRELSAALADTDVASTAPEPALELAQLLAEMLREVTGAIETTVVFDATVAGRPIDVTAREAEADTWSEVFPPSPRAHVGEAELVTERIRSIDGTHYGIIEIACVASRAFPADDRATVRQVADLAGAWLDRTRRSRRP